MALLDALIPPREQKILGALLLHPQTSYALNDLIRIGGTSRSQAGVVIDRFVAAGLAREQRIGNQRRIQADTGWPLFEDVRALCVKSFGVAEPIAQALEPLLPKIELAFLFGSVVRGTDHASSDIDLMVVGTVGNADLFAALGRVNDVLRRPVNFNVYSPREWNRLQDDPVIASILHGSRVTLHERAAAPRQPAEPARARLPEGSRGAASRGGKLLPAGRNGPRGRRPAGA